jgi:hypothetical protein
MNKAKTLVVSIGSLGISPKTKNLNTNFDLDVAGTEVGEDRSDIRKERSLRLSTLRHN